jgi:hypothetical protein
MVRYEVLLSNGQKMFVDQMGIDDNSANRASYLLSEILQAVAYRLYFNCSNQEAGEAYKINISRLQQAFNLAYCHPLIRNEVVTLCMKYKKVDWLRYKKLKVVEVNIIE